ncbi:MAG: acetolactate decarboxylase [Pisciglobus halotolerans]|nr:acetolactate decarboxylase [Pisciglobus halotolerans]
MAGKLYQHGTVAELTTGLFEGTLSLDRLLDNGDYGIGTLDGLDGELIIKDKKAYQIKGDGSVIRLSGEKTVPYAAVTFFHPEQQIKVEREKNSKDIKKLLTSKLSSLNTFQSVVIKGQFVNLKVRAVEKQQKPYPSLVEAARKQVEFEKKKSSGTIIGFYSPDLFQGIASAGYHWHFLSDDCLFGGHLLDFKMENGEILLETIELFEQHFPIMNPQFMQQQQDYTNLQKDIKEAEE